MFSVLSKSGVGLYVLIIQIVLDAIGIQAPEGTVTAVVDSLVTLVSFALLVWGQLDRKDLTAGIIRK